MDTSLYFALLIAAIVSAIALYLAYHLGVRHERARVLRVAKAEKEGWEKALNDKPEVNMETEMYWTGARYGVLRLLDKINEEGAPHV